MEFIAWLWWITATVFGFVLTVLWFLVSGWVSALLQIALLVAVIYFMKYGWQRAPSEIWRRTRSFAGFFVSWVRAGEPAVASSPRPSAVQVVRTKEFGDVNISTLLSLLLLAKRVFLTISGAYAYGGR